MWRSLKSSLGQMLVINQQIDKLTATHVDFKKCEMLKGSVLPFHLLPNSVIACDNEGEEFGVIDEPESLSEIQLAKTYSMSWANIGEAITDLLLKLVECLAIFISSPNSSQNSHCLHVNSSVCRSSCSDQKKRPKPD